MATSLHHAHGVVCRHPYHGLNDVALFKLLVLILHRALRYNDMRSIDPAAHDAFLATVLPSCLLAFELVRAGPRLNIDSLLRLVTLG